MEAGFDRQVVAGEVGKVCRYRGSAAAGFVIELAPGDVLSVTPDQVRALWAASAADNIVLRECPGYRSRASGFVGFMRRWLSWLGSWSRAQPSSRPVGVAPLPASRLTPENAAAVLGRSVDREGVACIQSVLAAEGLPAAGPDVATAALGLVGRTVIYEEGGDVLAVELIDVTTGGPDGGQLRLHFRNLSLPGFATNFPAEFTAGGSAAETWMRSGSVAGYMGIWSLITGPGAVERIVDLARRVVGRRALRLECRRLTRDRTVSY